MTHREKRQPRERVTVRTRLAEANFNSDGSSNPLFSAPLRHSQGLCKPGFVSPGSQRRDADNEASDHPGEKSELPV